MVKTSKISIVTACFNMADYVEQTIQSVLSQNYQNFEYILVDGASTDGTTAIINSYADRIDKIICEPDSGQYHAIQKGFNLANGEIMAWLNADDIYFPWTLSVVNEIFTKFPNVDWVIGLPSYLNKNGQLVSIKNNVASFPRKYIRNGRYKEGFAGYLQQESMFWRSSLWERVGGLDLSYNIAADFKLWTEFAQLADLVAVSVPLAAFRLLPFEQRSVKQKDIYDKEISMACKGLTPPSLAWQFLAKWGLPLRCLCRLAIWKKSRFISYSKESQAWVLASSIRPISKDSLSGLLLENKIR
ncbi:MAG: glycosyltransferase [Desulfobacterales bacterium]|nr:glycosyltransferase [Desulfobacterales bacterium]